MSVRKILRKVWFKMRLTPDEEGIAAYRSTDALARQATDSTEKLAHVQARGRVAQTLSKSDMRRAKAAVDQDRARN